MKFPNGRFWKKCSNLFKSFFCHTQYIMYGPQRLYDVRRKHNFNIKCVFERGKTMYVCQEKPDLEKKVKSYLAQEEFKRS